MILAIDIGNTNIVLGCIEEGEIRLMVRMSTDRVKTGDEYALSLHEFLRLHGIEGRRLEGAILSSVVPGLTGPMKYAIRLVTGHTPLVVGAGLKTGLNLLIDNPAQLGADLVVDAVAACALYPAPILIFDMGTATTLSLIDEKGNYRGGMIIPGAGLSLEALASRTSQLPKMGIEAPKGLIGANTVDCMRAGVVYSGAAMIDGLIQRVNETLSRPAAAVLTGGVAEVFLPYCKEKVIYNKNLLLDGLWLLYCKNKKK